MHPTQKGLFDKAHELLSPDIRHSIIFTGPYQHKLGSRCWEWDGKRWSRNGYGRVKDDAGKERAVHRVVYEKLIGPIPPKHVLDHLCRNRACCNPSHAEPVTHQENTLRGKAELFKPIPHYQQPAEPPPREPPAMQEVRKPMQPVYFYAGLAFVLCAIAGAVIVAAFT